MKADSTDNRKIAGPSVKIQDDRIIVRRYASRDRLVARRVSDDRYWVALEFADWVGARIVLGHLSRAALRGVLREWGVSRGDCDEFLGKGKATA